MGQEIKGKVVVTPGLVEYEGNSAKLTARKGKIMEILVQKDGRIATHDQIFDHVYGHMPECDWPNMNVIWTQISQMRPLLAPLGLEIESAKGVGFRLKCKRSSPP